MNGMRGFGLVVAALSLVGCGGGGEGTCAPVELQSRFDRDTVVPKGCYLALQTPIIAAGVTVTLEPGVQITFSQDTALEFSADSTLVAVGTAKLPILLTAAQPERGFWQGVHFDATSSTANRLEYVTVEYGGSTAHDYNGAGVKATADSRGVNLSLAHTTIRQSQGFGLYLDGSARVPVFADNTLTENGLGPASVDSDVAGLLDVGSTYSGNDVDEVMVRTNRISTASTWAAIGVPYHLSDNLNVDAPWTIAAGNTLILGAEAWISVNGDEAALSAVGTALEPILFTGEEPVRGYWESLVFNGTMHAGNRLEFVTVEYGGSTLHDADGAGVKAIADSHGVTLHIANTLIQHSQGWGLYLTGSAQTPVFANNSFTLNGLGAASVGSEAVHQLETSSVYTGNDVERVQVRDRYISMSATWQDLGVPYNMELGLTVNGTEAKPVVWTLAPGVTMILPEDAIISVATDHCGLSARGTVEEPIRITGAEQTKGFWKSIVFDGTNNGANAIEYATIEYGGAVGGSGEQGMIQAQADSHGVGVNVTNCTIQHSGLYGIWFGGSASGDIETGNTFLDNDAGDIFRQ